MFIRREDTYDAGLSLSSAYRPDPANPLVNISGLIPKNSAVLDIGCGNGALGRLFRDMSKEVVIDGIEPSEYAAALAEPYYRKVYRGTAQDRLQDIGRAGYDYIILADVLEHMPDPLALLSKLAASISDTAKVIISVPNAAFGAIRLALLNGRFDYVDSGIIERTHLRFFTLSTIREVIERSGLSISELRYLMKNFFVSEIDLKPYRGQFLTIARLLRDKNASIYQFLLVVSKKSGGKPMISSAGCGTNMVDYAKFLVKGVLGR